MTKTENKYSGLEDLQKEAWFYRPWFQAPSKGLLQAVRSPTTPCLTSSLCPEPSDASGCCVHALPQPKWSQVERKQGCRPRELPLTGLGEQRKYQIKAGASLPWAVLHPFGMYLPQCLMIVNASVPMLWILLS